jgi:drug/metabolite transporter (DMT)-like permease
MSVAAGMIDHAEHRAAGVLWMLATMFCFISLDTTMKFLLAAYPLVEVTWARFFFATFFAAAIAGPNLPDALRSRAPILQTARSLILMVTTGVFNAGVKLLPLATATAIMFTTPILVTVLSIPILKEEVGMRRWIGVALGFLGALIVVRPGLGGLGFGALFLVIAALLNANYQILTRKVRIHDQPITSLLYTAATGAIVTSALLPFDWRWPSASGWFLFALSGLMGCLGHLCLIQAFRRAPASVVAPFSYSSLVWASLYGWFIFAEWPDLWTWVGAALIIGSGLYIFHRERLKHHEEPT